MATIDPWGGEELAVFSTTDFLNFTRHHINWPTKEALAPVKHPMVLWFGLPQCVKLQTESIICTFL